MSSAKVPFSKYSFLIESRLWPWRVEGLFALFTLRPRISKLGESGTMLPDVLRRKLLSTVWVGREGLPEADMESAESGNSRRSRDRPWPCFRREGLWAEASLRF